MSEDLSEVYAQFKEVFFEECRELFADLEQQLAQLEEGNRDTEILHAIFRVIHSVKAGAATFGFSHLVRFTHNFEALLDRVRNGRIELTDELIGTLFRASDLASDLVECAETGTELGDAATADVEQEIQRLMGGASTAPTNNGQEVKTDGTDERLVRYRIEFKPYESLFLHANEPLLLFRELGELGSVDIVADISGLPPLAEMEPEKAYLSWVLYLETSEGEDAVEEVFEFVEDECELSISVTDIQEASDDEDEGFGLFDDDEPAAAAPSMAGQSPEPANLPTGQPAAAQPPAKTMGGKAGSIRVDLTRVDRLVDMVGEIVITQSMLAQEMATREELRNSRIGTGMEELSHHIRDLQDNVMAVRMQPVKSVFSRMPRIVRDVAAKLGKKVKLVTEGETTEVDKTVIEELADPLTHMIRNSMDHGLEMPEERLEAGKPEEGTIRLSAEHRGGRIIIEIRDDGRGINRPKVLEIAKSRGIVDENAELLDEEIDNLIFAPGFSTADSVTDLSGRGVGMDVVRRNIQSLGGRVSVQSETGIGTTFRMTLPLTLAVLDGMVVGIGDQRFVVPISIIIETVRPPAQDVNDLVGGGQVMHIRGNYVRLVPIAKLFGIEGAETDPSKGLVVLVEADGGRTIGLVVDQLAGQQQVVIKSLEQNYQAVDGIASATILGDGSICLILDIDELADMDMAQHSEHPPRMAVPAE